MDSFNQILADMDKNPIKHSIYEVLNPYIENDEFKVKYYGNKLSNELLTRLLELAGLKKYNLKTARCYISKHLKNK